MTMDPNQQQPAPPPPPPPQQQASYGHPHGAPFQHLLQQQQHQQLQMFWNYQRQEIEHSSDFKNHQLPLARIKKIMKADEDVRMISAEAPVLFAKACELFILELTIRSWLHAEENKRRTLQKNDIAAAINRTDIFDFLVDIVPRDDGKEEEGVAAAAAAASSAAAVVAGTAAAAAAAAAGVPYYYPAMGQPAVVPGLDPAAAAAYGQPAWQGMWGPQPPSQHLHGGGGEEGGGSYGGAPRMDGSGYVRNPNQEGS